LNQVPILKATTPDAIRIRETARAPGLTIDLIGSGAVEEYSHLCVTTEHFLMTGNVSKKIIKIIKSAAPAEAPNAPNATAVGLLN
jgi:hypothetical protein